MRNQFSECILIGGEEGKARYACSRGYTSTRSCGRCKSSCKERWYETMVCFMNTNHRLNRSDDDENLCKICYDGKINTVIIPCMFLGNFLFLLVMSNTHQVVILRCAPGAARRSLVPEARKNVSLLILALYFLYYCYFLILW